MKKIPMRSCVITKEKCEKKDLIRVVRTPEKNVCVDLSGRCNGKGAYLKKDLEVLEKAKKSKTLDRVLEVEVPEGIYDEIKEIIENK